MPFHAFELSKGFRGKSKEWLKTGRGEMFGGEQPDTDLNQLIRDIQGPGPAFQGIHLIADKTAFSGPKERQSRSGP
jgi:hypothetical protein